MTERKLTVGYVPGDGKHYPLIRLQGKWLEELGFMVGDRVVVVVNEEHLIIKKDNDYLLRGPLGGF
ncbi:MAG: SymE family type I addiction module toxin [Dehalococcoidia bacterium]|jgi:toxic protein SymE